MSAAIPDVKMRLTSEPYSRRVGLWPLVAGVVIGWFFCLIWILVCVFTFAYNVYWSILITASTLVFAVLLTAMTQRLVVEAHCRYVIELTADEAVLITDDRLKRRTFTKMVLLDDVKYAEYYPFADSACVILHTDYTSMEMPLWPLGKQSRDAIDFLQGRGIHVVNVQSDDQIPA